MDAGAAGCIGTAQHAGRATTEHGTGDLSFANAHRTAPHRSAPGRYLLAGTIRCAHCGKAMFGSTAKGNSYYRCSATRPDYATSSVPGHPVNYSVREERILAALDPWLGTLANHDRIDDTVASILHADDHADREPAQVAQARRQRERLHVELDRVIAAIRAGVDPTVAAGQVREIQAGIEAASQLVERWERSHEPVVPLTEAEIRAALSKTAGLARLLRTADRAQRAAVYQSFGLSLAYERKAPTGPEIVHARLELRGGGGGI